MFKGRALACLRWDAFVVRGHVTKGRKVREANARAQPVIGLVLAGDSFILPVVFIPEPDGSSVSDL